MSHKPRAVQEMADEAFVRFNMDQLGASNFLAKLAVC